MQLRVTYFPFELLYSKPRDASLVRPASMSFLPVASLLTTHWELILASRVYVVPSRDSGGCTLTSEDSSYSTLSIPACEGCTHTEPVLTGHERCEEKSWTQEHHCCVWRCAADSAWASHPPAGDGSRLSDWYMYASSNCRCIIGEAVLDRQSIIMQGAVLVTVKKASDLPAADGNGLSDPYVRLTLDERKQKTSIQRRTLTPTWNEKKEWMHVRAPPLALAEAAASSCLSVEVHGNPHSSRSKCPPSRLHHHASMK